MINKVHFNNYVPNYSYLSYELRTALGFSESEKRMWLNRMYYKEPNQIEYCSLLTVCLHKIYGNETI